MTQRTSERGSQLIGQFEGLRLRAYRCPAGIWTIGFGHTGADVHSGLTITMARAVELLRADLRRFERAVTRLAGPCDQEHFDALVSLAYNVGEANFAKSSVLRHHKRGDEEQAARAFALWNKARVKGKLTVLAGLTRRRAAEASMYREGDFADVSKDRPIAMVELSDAQIAAGVESMQESAMKPAQPGGIGDLATSGRVVRGAITAPAAGGLALSTIESQDQADVAATATQGVERTLEQADAAGASVDPGAVVAQLERAKDVVDAQAASGWDWQTISLVLAALLVGIAIHAIYAAVTAHRGDR